MASFNVDYDPGSWVQVPFEFPTALGHTAQQWAAQTAQEQRDRGHAETPQSGTLDDYFLGLVRVAQDATRAVDHTSMWALINRDAPGFVMVALDLEPADGSVEEFAKAASARRANEYEPATVTPIELPNLGDGVRVVRHDFDESRQVMASVAYLFRVEDLDFMLMTQSYDLVTVDWAFPLFEELLAGAKITVG